MYLAQREPYPATANRYQIGDAAPVLDQGRIWVKIDPTNGTVMVDGGVVYLKSIRETNAGTFRRGQRERERRPGHAGEVPDRRIGRGRWRRST